jgi:hypothetical protein
MSKLKAILQGEYVKNLRQYYKANMSKLKAILQG